MLTFLKHLLLIPSIIGTIVGGVWLYVYGWKTLFFNFVFDGCGEGLLQARCDVLNSQTSWFVGALVGGLVFICIMYAWAEAEKELKTKSKKQKKTKTPKEKDDKSWLAS